MVDEMDDKILLGNLLQWGLFIHKLYDQKPQTMAELIHLVQSFMNAEDMIIAKKKKKAETSGKWLCTSSKARPSSKEGQDRGKKGPRWQEGRIVLRTIF